MSNTQELRLVRRWLNESRMVNLSAFLTVNDSVKEREGQNKRRVVAQLRGLDEFANATEHEEYRPA
ncbi:hypothetical protein [Streptomyces sp. NPDC094466]|uniref:hypothetical protein n=1 Tax=Streptomyces sp. NPDC094466 TaxID=3366065 RepID=UPI00382E2360